MERNFFRRVEVAFPIRRDAHRARILQELETYLSDDTQAWELGRDGIYCKVPTSKDSPVSAQTQLLAKYAAGTAIKL
jgi:polyphosphate kinase